MKLFVDVECPHCRAKERQSIVIDNKQLWEIITGLPKIKAKCKTCERMYTVEITADIKAV